MHCWVVGHRGALPCSLDARPLNPIIHHKRTQVRLSHFVASWFEVAAFFCCCFKETDTTKANSILGVALIVIVAEASQLRHTLLNGVRGVSQTRTGGGHSLSALDRGQQQPPPSYLFFA